MQEKPEIVKATHDLENGHADSLQNLVQNKFQEERISILKEVEQQNQLDQKANKNTPGLSLEVGSSYGGSNWLRLERDEHTIGNAILGSPPIYIDQMDLRTQKHATLGDNTPPSRRDVDARALTNKLEAGQGSGTEALLNGMYEEERVRVFEAVEKQNQQDLRAGKTKATLDIQITPNKTGEDMISVTRVLPGIHDAIFGGQQIYSDWLRLQTGERQTRESKDTRS